MSISDNQQVKKRVNEVLANSSKLVMIVLIVLLILFLLFSAGALSVSIKDNGAMGLGWETGISWMWVPALLFLILSVLLSWSIFNKKRA